MQPKKRKSKKYDLQKNIEEQNIRWKKWAEDVAKRSRKIF